MSIENFDMSQADARELIEDIILRNNPNEEKLYPNKRDCFNFYVYLFILDCNEENKKYTKSMPNFNEEQMKYFCTQHEKNTERLRKIINNADADSDSDSDSDSDRPYYRDSDSEIESDGAYDCRDGCECE
jgi:hypothetical protein